MCPVRSFDRVVDEAYSDFEDASSLNMSIVDQSITTFFDVIGYNVSFMADLPAVTQTGEGALSTYFGTGQRPSQQAMRNGGREQAVFEAFSAIGNNNAMLGYVYMGDVDGGYLEWPGTAEYGEWDPRTRPWFSMGRDNNFESLTELDAPHFDSIANTDTGIVAFDIDGVTYQANIYRSEALGHPDAGALTSEFNQWSRHLPGRSVLSGGSSP